jgi:tRNA-dihydrouridine synthase B
MAGCTDLPFRRIARRFGCELAFTEMVKDIPVSRGDERTLQMLATAEWDHPLGMQLVGREPATMAEAARRLEGLGADVIDVNLGCPVRKVVSAGCGAALLKEPDQVARVLESMVRAVGVPVTIKMRTGFDEGDDDKFLRIARHAEECGAGAITAHGRTRRQGFSGMANHEAIRRVKESVSIPVIGNGDVRSGADAERMFRETGCDGVMLARGSLGNPWVYREVAEYLRAGTLPSPPTAAERAETLREHFGLLREHYGERMAFLKVRPVINWYVKGLPGGTRLRDLGSRVDSIEAFEAVAGGVAASCHQR